MPKTLIDKDFEPDCRRAVDTLKGALIELYASVGADPTSPQDAARRFKVNKTLTWNLSKVMGSSDPMASLPNVPGASALAGLLKAVQRDGASSEHVERVRDAAEALDKIISLHVGDRATLELVIDNMGRGRGDHLELSRRLAFRGSSGLWGVQAKTRLNTALIAPNPSDPDRIDMAIVRGYLGFRRLRTDVRWPIFQVRGWGQEGEGVASTTWQPLEHHESSNNGMPLLTRFSTVALEDIEVVHTPQGTDYMLAAGPIGNAGAVDCFLADCERSAASKYRTPEDTTGEFGATISVPTERLIFDLLAHKSLDFALSPQVLAFGGIFMQRNEGASPETLLPIPVPQMITPLPGQPPVVATSHVPEYPKILSYTQERMGWDAADFRGVRYEMDYPPLGSTVLLRFKLLSQPGASADNPAKK